MKMYGVREGEGQPEGSRPEIWKKRFPVASSTSVSPGCQHWQSY